VLNTQLAIVLEDREGVYGVVADAMDRREQVDVQADHPFRAASVYKIFVAYAVLHEVDLGRLTLDQPLVLADEDDREPEPASGLELGQIVTVREALAAMLGVSSNLAAHRLLRLVGRSNLNHLLARLGLKVSRLPILEEVSPWPEDGVAPDAAMTTPAEMAHFLHRLLSGKLLRDPSRMELANGLQVTEELDPVARGLPNSAAVFAKLGELEDAANVAGWVNTRQGPVVLAMFSEGTDPGTARETIGQLAIRIFDYYNR
jgi:beta-lactamase class A